MESGLVNLLHGIGETDWKVMAIDVNDPLAENLNDIQDVDKIMPGFLKVNIHHLKVAHTTSVTIVCI